MTSSSDLRVATQPGGTVVRGLDQRYLRPARLDADLRTSAFVTTHGADPRLFDPTLELVVAQAAAIAQDEGREAGYLAGYQVGELAGLRAAEQAVAQQQLVRDDRERALDRHRQERLAAALLVLTAAAADLDRREVPVRAQVEQLAAALAVDLVEALVGHHLTVGDCAARDAVARALRLAPDGAAATVRLHPDDAAALTAAPLATTGRVVTIVADPALARGDCLVDCGPRRIDAKLALALQRAREVIGG